MNATHLKAKFWTSKTVLHLASLHKPLAILLYLHLIGCEARTPSGIFKFDVDDIQEQTGLTARQIKAALGDLVETGKVIKSGKWVFVVEALYETFNVKPGNLSQSIKYSVLNTLRARTMPSDLKASFSKRYNDLCSPWVSPDRPPDPRFEGLLDTGGQLVESLKPKSLKPKAKSLKAEKLNSTVEIADEDITVIAENIETLLTDFKPVARMISFIFTTLGLQFGTNGQRESIQTEIIIKAIDQGLSQGEMTFQLDRFLLASKQDKTPGNPHYLKYNDTPEHLKNTIKKWLEKSLSLDAAVDKGAQ